MLSIYKNSAREAGPWVPSGQNKISWTDYLAPGELVHLDKNYLQLGVDVVGYEFAIDDAIYTVLPPGSTQPVWAWYFGSNKSDMGLNLIDGISGGQQLRANWTNQLRYNQGCIIGNSYLDAFTKGNLETNRQINFLRETMNYYTSTDDLNTTKTLNGWGYDVNSFEIAVNRNEDTYYSYLTSPILTPFNNIVLLNNNGEALADTIKTTYEQANVLIPMSYPYQLGKSKLPSSLQRLDYVVELESKAQCIAQYNKYPGNLFLTQDPRDCDDIADGGAVANQFTLSADNANYLSVGDTFVIRFDFDFAGGPIVHQQGLRYGVVQAVGGVGNRIITATLNLFFVGETNIDTFTVQKYNGSFIDHGFFGANPNSVPANQAVIADNKVYINAPAIGGWAPNDIPFYVGQLVVVEYETNTGIDATDANRNLEVVRRQRVIRKISLNNAVVNNLKVNPYAQSLVIEFDPGNPAVNLPQMYLGSQGLIWAPTWTTAPSFQVNSASMTNWKQTLPLDSELLKNPVPYEKLNLIAHNRLQNINFEKSYQLNNGFLRCMILNRLTTLLSNDRNLKSWRIYEDQVSTTDRDLTFKSFLNKDRLQSVLMTELRSLKNLPASTQYGNFGVGVIVESNRTRSGMPIMDLQQLAIGLANPAELDDTVQGNLEQSLVLLYQFLEASV